MSFGDRILDFSSYEEPADDSSYNEDEGRYVSASTSLLQSGAYVPGAFAMNLSKLSEKRRRPFVGSGIALGLFGIVLTLSALGFATSGYRQLITMGSSQALVSYLCMGMGMGVAMLTMMHMYAVYQFSFENGSARYVSFTDLLQKLSFLTLPCMTCVVLRMWQNSQDQVKINAVLAFVAHPNKVWMLGNIITMALVMSLFLLVSTSIPYKKINNVYSSSISTFSLLTTGVSIATSVLSGVYILSNNSLHTHFPEITYGTFGYNIFLAVSSLSLTLACYKAERINALWLLLNLMNMGSSMALTVFGYLTAGIIAESSFFLISLSFISACLLTITWMHQLVWRYISYYDVSNRFNKNTNQQQQQNAGMYTSY